MPSVAVFGDEVAHFLKFVGPSPRSLVCMRLFGLVVGELCLSLVHVAGIQTLHAEI